MGTTWNGHFDWSDENVATLKKLFDEGHSFSVIAKRMGGGLTRNACLGKAHRMGFAQRDRASAPASSRPAPRPPVVKPSAPAVPVRRASASRPTPAPAPPPRIGIAGNGTTYEQAPAAKMPRMRDVAATGVPARIIDPGFGGCRWPITDPGRGDMHETIFCCGSRPVGQPYCTAHQSLATTGETYPNGKKVQTAKQLTRSLRRHLAC